MEGSPIKEKVYLIWVDGATGPREWMALRNGHTAAKVEYVLGENYGYRNVHRLACQIDTISPFVLSLLERQYGNGR